MTADEPRIRDEAERASESLRDVLFAADLKKLVRASREDDGERVAEIRRHYGKK
ncbi:hypothetical protein [Actinorugispora endophytica]|uniref:Uncharacterized protein n=1 Tax=Actinorugispora endophytica TaxID=1605990 RepID=A0A4R6UQP1_9ACTN|nr:hypothetical protein [Actinorugispora endophytica]TDQ49272.1 hypothetical protein EV190_11668 [Actinorugispora endophytica]